MIEVLEPGLLTTVQDRGRFGWQRYGIVAAGAADQAALILGNRLVGNDTGAAALEITLLGPRLRFHRDAVIAITGADLGANIDGSGPVPVGVTTTVPAGSELSFSGGRRGCRAYLCVAGGFDVPLVLGSRSTDLLAGIGGWEGRALQSGDRLPIGARSAQPTVHRLNWTFVPASGPFQLRAVPFDDRSLFVVTALEEFVAASYRVDIRSDRMGVRLNGPAVNRRPGEVLSEGQPLGAIQVPPDGQPIVAMAGRATVGGYPKLGVVVAPDVSLLAQARPGDEVRFSWVDAATARRIYHDWWQRLHSA